MFIYAQLDDNWAFFVPFVLHAFFLFMNFSDKKSLAEKLLNKFGWCFEGVKPKEKSYVLIGVPHTSNWDFILMLVLSKIIDQKFYWMGKDSLFRWPFGILLRKLGGVAINRKVNSNTVLNAVLQFKKHKEFVIVITPEGTRKKTAFWRSGFYYIAKGANVPIVFGYADYKKKILGIGQSILPTGDIESDLNIIREFYRKINAKYPNSVSNIDFRNRV